MKKAYDTYKDSGIESIGDVPSYWELLPVRYYVTLVKGTKPKELTDINTGFPYLTMDYLRGRDGKTTMYPSSIDGLELIDENEILVLWDGANAGEFLLSKKGYLGSTMAKITVNPLKYDKQYFYFLLKTIEKVSKDYANGTTIPHFDSKVLTDYYYPCPSLVEQKAIAEFLDNKCGKIDSLVADLESQVADLEVLRKSEISRIVTKGLNPDVPLKKTGIEWVGDIPTSWQLVRLGQYTSKIGSGITPRGGSETYVENGIPLLRSQNILFDRIDVSDVAYITEEVDELMKGSRVLPGDVLLNITGASIGRCYYINEAFGPANVNQHVCIIRPKGFDTRYLYYALSSECCQTQIKVLQTGGNREGLTVEALKSFKIPMPSIYEQVKIANYLDSYRLMIDEIISLILSQISDLKLYKQSLISEAVTGKIKIID